MLIKITNNAGYYLGGLDIPIVVQAMKSHGEYMVHSDDIKKLGGDVNGKFVYFFSKDHAEIVEEPAKKPDLAPVCGVPSPECSVSKDDTDQLTGAILRHVHAYMQGDTVDSDGFSRMFKVISNAERIISRGREGEI